MAKKTIVFNRKEDYCIQLLSGCLDER